MRTAAPPATIEEPGEETFRTRVLRLAGAPVVLERLSIAVVVSIVALIGSGGWVRLSSSGLGCPTWPSCTHRQLVAPAQYHALVEFVNRCVITTVGVVIAATVLAALAGRPRRKTLWIPAAGLAVGYLGEAVLGGITVLLKLPPALVAAHLVLAMALLADAVVLHWRARAARQGMPAPTAGQGAWGLRRAPRTLDAVVLADLCLAVLAVLVVVGTVVTGSGPHSGSPGTPRFGFRFTAVVQLHADIGLFLYGCIVGLGFLLHADRELPRRIVLRHRLVAVLLVAQGALGYATYFSHVEVDVTEVHVFGAAVVVVALLHLRLDLAWTRRPAVSDRPGGPVAAGPGWPPGAPPWLR